jgi:hypothetical protein
MSKPFLKISSLCSSSSSAILFLKATCTRKEQKHPWKSTFRILQIILKCMSGKFYMELNSIVQVITVIVKNVQVLDVKFMFAGMPYWNS